MAEKKTRVVVLYGGRSGEHEVSLESAASVLRNLDPERYEAIPVAIDKDGQWRIGDISLIEAGRLKALPVFRDQPPVALQGSRAAGEGALIPLGGSGSARPVDVVFPVMHGTYCEDGAIQGLLELADVAYVGSGIAGSAIGMDKVLAKRLAEASGIRVVPYAVVRKAAWEKNRNKEAERVWSQLAPPVFVKPVASGSSVGVHKVKRPDELASALDDALRYDSRALVEKAVDAREIELSVLENIDDPGAPLVSCAGEVEPTHEFYSYEAKYLDDQGARFSIPARLTEAQSAEARDIGRRAFLALCLESMARVDLFLDRGSGAFFLNEVNTIPGFTAISMYPKLWAASGIPYPELLSRLIELARARHREKRALTRSFRP